MHPATGSIELNGTVAKVIAGVNDEFNHNQFESVYFPDWDNKPPLIPPVLSLNSTPILTHQNSSAIIAKPGMGKTSIIEAIPANYLNPQSDSLGFIVSGECEGIIIIDNERTNSDVWNSFYRMCKRAGIQEGQKVEGVVIAGMRSISRMEERRRVVEGLIKKHPCSLLLIDGAGDFVYDTNDLTQAIECRIWYRELTVKYNLSILSTLHPNPGGDKPRGHQGSEICREAECVMLVKAHENDSRCITSDFEHGKNRNNPKLTSAFKWSENKRMFLFADYDEMLVGKEIAKRDAKLRDLRSIAEGVIGPPKAFKYVDLIEELKMHAIVSSSTAKTRVKEMKEAGIIHLHDDGLYRLKI
ncbi:MAG: ATP-binding protein [Chitinophagaceae bacterium]|nr:ATP-binding protein [Chitinophagaceae bacterium]MCW5928441.1 ATP-binding protein [Chitinophagaceae bacterium]